MYIRRKVYSDFNDFNYDYEPQLYSVTMDEDELALFSEFENAYYEALYSDESDVQSGRDIGSLVGGAVGAGAAGYGAHRYLRGMESRANKALSKAQEAKRAAIEANEKGILTRKVEHENFGKMSDAEFELWKKNNGVKKSMTRNEALSELAKKHTNLNNKELKAISEARDAGRKAAAKQNWGKFINSHKKAAGVAAAGVGLAGLAAGSSIGRPIGGAVNR